MDSVCDSQEVCVCMRVYMQSTGEEGSKSDCYLMRVTPLQCHDFVADNEEDIEQWWFKK